jgi:hypothetical protein
MQQTKKCANCGWISLTWREARQSYARMIARGLTPEEAKKHSPYCYRCTSTLLRELPTQATLTHCRTTAEVAHSQNPK